MALPSDSRQPAIRSVGQTASQSETRIALNCSLDYTIECPQVRLLVAGNASETCWETLTRIGPMHRRLRKQENCM